MYTRASEGRGGGLTFRWAQERLSRRIHKNMYFQSHRECGLKITILKRTSESHFKVSVRFTRSGSGAFLRTKVGKGRRGRGMFSGRLKTLRVVKNQTPNLRLASHPAAEIRKRPISKPRRGDWKLMRFVTSKESASGAQTSGQNESRCCVRFGDTLIQKVGATNWVRFIKSGLIMGEHAAHRLDD